MTEGTDLVAEQIASHRARLGLSLEDAASRSSIDMQRLAEAENSESRLSEAELQQLADAYGVDVTAFFGGRVTPLQYLFGAG
ncbi:MAG: helix-turn-helix transcriptional regulator [Candidatus Eremiobacteraeota bacterium]|nr:helix-turn-helix transcriptional regulator [Candidatus Eremiobacteraeota bacterium]